MQPLDGSESLVIDCSITMTWNFKDEATRYTNAVRAALANERAAVPVLWPLEVAIVLLMGERRKRSTQAKAAKWLRILAALPIAADVQSPGLAFDTIIDLGAALLGGFTPARSMAKRIASFPTRLRLTDPTRNRRLSRRPTNPRWRGPG
jgi:hypothetical protein